jgi:transcriptional regulator with XRE-family HTH domain
VTEASTIGVRLKEMRQRLGLTLLETSARTNVSVSTLSKIENGQASPSFDIIKRISDGLDIDLEDFVRAGPKSEVSGRKTVTRLGDGDHFTSGQYDYKAHASELSRKGMAPLEMWVRARSVDEFDHWSSHRGEEFVFVLSGAIEVHTEFYTAFRLSAGESAYFDSSMKHLFLSVGDEDARILSVSYDARTGADQVTRFMHPDVKPVAEPSDV